MLIDSLGSYGMIWVMGAIGLVMLYIPVLIRERDFAESEPATLGLVDTEDHLQEPTVPDLSGRQCHLLARVQHRHLNIPAYVTSTARGTEGDTAIYFGRPGCSSDLLPTGEYPLQETRLER